MPRHTRTQRTRYSMMITTALTSTVLALSVSDAAAQSRAPLALEEIVVTAERRESSLQSTPVTVSAFTADDLGRAQISRTEQIQDFVPNLYLSDGVNSPATISVALRGLQESGGGIATSEPPVAFYIDDVYQARLSAANNEFADIERVEVLRGPQGTLFGRNSMAGAINIISKTPDDEMFAKGELSFGRFDTAVAKAAVGGPISEGVLAASISVAYRDQGKGFKDNIATGEDVDQNDYLGLRGKLHYYGSETIDAELIVYYSDTENDGFVATAIGKPSLEPITGDYFDVQIPIDTFGDSEQFGVTGKVTADFGNVTFKSITGYAELDDDWRFDLGGGLEFMPGDFRAVFDRTSAIEQDQFTQEVQLFGDAMDDRLSWILGGYYFTEESSQQFTDFFFIQALGFAIPLPLTDYTMQTDSYAVYGQATYDLTDRLSLITGLRYSDETKEIAGTKGAAFSDETSYSALTPKVGLEYALNDDAFLYATVSRGFKAGGYQGLGGDANALSTPFDEETVWSYEAGAKLDLLDNRVRLNTAVFFQDVKDLQSPIFQPGQTGNAITQNAIDLEIYGVETELTAIVSDGLTISAVLGLQDETFTRIDPNAVLFGSGATRVPGVSHYNGAIGFNYDSAPGLIGDGYLFFGGDFTFRDKFFTSADNNAISMGSAQSRVNAQVGYRSGDERWSVVLSGRNLTDEVDWTNGTDLGLPTQGIRQTLDPLTWQLSLKFAY